MQNIYLPFGWLTRVNLSCMRGTVVKWPRHCPIACGHDVDKAHLMIQSHPHTSCITHRVSYIVFGRHILHLGVYILSGCHCIWVSLHLMLSSCWCWYLTPCIHIPLPLPPVVEPVPSHAAPHPQRGARVRRHSVAAEGQPAARATSTAGGMPRQADGGRAGAERVLEKRGFGQEGESVSTSSENNKKKKGLIHAYMVHVFRCS